MTFPIFLKVHKLYQTLKIFQAFLKAIHFYYLAAKWNCRTVIPRQEFPVLLGDVQFFNYSCLNILKTKVLDNLKSNNISNEAKEVSCMFDAFLSPFTDIKTILTC